MPHSKIDVLCVGMATYDIVLTVEAHPLPDDKVFAGTCLTCGGGPAANAAVAVARLGGRAAFAGYLGNDRYGQVHLAELRAAGVRTAYVTRGSHPTRLAVVLVKPTGERTVICYRGNTPPVTTSTLRLARVQPRTILFDGHEPALSLPLARQARAAGIPVILDAGSVHEGTRCLLPFTDYLVCSRKFAETLFPGVEPAVMLDRLQTYTSRVFITLGAAGVIWKCGHVYGSLPAYKVDVVDTTGAGDVFHGAFALGIAGGRPDAIVLRYASAAAALCCCKQGARPGCPAAEEVEALLEKQQPARA